MKLIFKTDSNMAAETALIFTHPNEKELNDLVKNKIN